ncbi:hypothetical protein [Streptacidiphilus sp. MAP5-52]|uniref:hypothetical protein n=1 Tax=Streptacidiphilus sp. MAP5-52 TaxID=3156267 RepID=UPI0035182EFE
MPDTSGNDRYLTDADPTALPPLPPEFQVPDLPLAENEPDPDRPIIRTVPHPEPLTPRGVLIVCPACSAQRDWLLLNVGEQVFVRCRCAHEWAERRLTRSDFDDSFSHIERIYPDFEVAMKAMGYDGVLKGLYFN